MIGLKNILVATDFSAPSLVALNYGRAFARSYGATLHVLHVLEDVPAYYGPEIGFAVADVDGNIEAAAQRELQASLRQDDDDSDRALAVRASVRLASNVANAVNQYALENDVDLIIAGTHGRNAVSRFLMGSVAERLVRSAPCPVLTVRARERDFIIGAVEDIQHVSAAAQP